MNQTREEEEIVQQLKNTLDMDCLLEGQITRKRRVFIYIDRRCLKNTISFLHDIGFTHLTTITGLEVEEHVELIYHLMREGIHIGVRLRLPLNELVVPTLTAIIPGASLYEREIHDILGVNVEGHPNLAKLILPDKWDESTPPLRKQKSSEKKPLDVTPRKRKQQQGKKKTR